MVYVFWNKNAHVYLTERCTLVGGFTLVDMFTVVANALYILWMLLWLHENRVYVCRQSFIFLGVYVCVRNAPESDNKIALFKFYVAHFKKTIV